MAPIWRTICLYVCPGTVSLPRTDNVPRKTSNAYQFSRLLNGGACLYVLNHQLWKMIHVRVLAGSERFTRALEIK